jgi:hypothetical protein
MRLWIAIFFFSHCNYGLNSFNVYKLQNYHLNLLSEYILIKNVELLRQEHTKIRLRESCSLLTQFSVKLIINNVYMYSLNCNSLLTNHQPNYFIRELHTILFFVSSLNL